MTAIGRAVLFSLAASLAGGAEPASFDLDQLVSGYDDGIEGPVDIWALRLTNPASHGLDITAIGLDLQAAELGVSRFIVDFQSYANPSDLGCVNGALPCFRGASIPDSFVVLPDGLDALSVNDLFTESEIIVNYTTPGGVLVAAGETRTIAHLSVPAGELLRIPANQNVLATLVTSSNTFLPLRVPEPATAALAAVVAFATTSTRRRT